MRRRAVVVVLDDLRRDMVGPETTPERHRFTDDLLAHGLMRSPRETQQATGRAWNQAVEIVPGWPLSP